MMGVREMERFLEQWQMDARDLRRRMILSPTPRERERWYALLLPAQGWDGFGGGRGPGTGPSHRRPMGRRLRRGRSRRLDFRAVRGFPPPSARRSSCLNYLHRLGFVLKRPKKRLVKADEAKRETFVAEYAVLASRARESGEKIFFADEAHFRADAELRGKWVLRGEPALADSGSPRYGEKASYYSAVCLETGEVKWMELEGNSNSRNIGRVPETVKREARRTAERDLRQRSGAPWRAGAGVPSGTRPGPAADEPAGLQPGLQRR